MKRIILGLIVVLMLSGCLTESRCKNIAVKQSDSYRDLGYGEGLDKGITIAEREIKSMREQYTPPEGCMILIIDDISAKLICKNLIGEEKYNEILNT